MSDESIAEFMSLIRSARSDIGEFTSQNTSFKYVIDHLNDWASGTARGRVNTDKMLSGVNDLAQQIEVATDLMNRCEMFAQKQDEINRILG